MSHDPRELDDDDIDARFRDIVGSLEFTGERPARQQSAADDGSSPVPPVATPAVPGGDVTGPPVPSLDVTPLDEEPFVPPEVELPPGEDLHFWGAVIGLTAGPVLLLFVAFARPGHSGWWLLLALAMTITGLGLLVTRQPARRDPDEGNGARV